eukprot:CAMPEP_0170076360 /NCGR_PEP_ID=MMETSP0019_2-20121128/13337_1 /TAXON_ID=98059 /ORGANISM="Dinobryon sp., Strain UTEXLB2267" /LENGTH=198 /DNA_ID=CAMNT_0010287931 /DNA_START=207 /DNA_END=803 /DNA_ORIENTATION=+
MKEILWMSFITSSPMELMILILNSNIGYKSVLSNPKSVRTSLVSKDKKNNEVKHSLVEDFHAIKEEKMLTNSLDSNNSVCLYLSSSSDEEDVVSLLEKNKKQVTTISTQTPFETDSDHSKNIPTTPQDTCDISPMKDFQEVRQMVDSSDSQIELLQLQFSDVEPYLSDEVVSTLWSRLIAVDKNLATYDRKNNKTKKI